MPSRSTGLREAKAWIKRGSLLPTDSYSARVRAGELHLKYGEAEPVQWFEGWDRDGVLYEDSRHLGQWDQTLAFLWFDDDDLPPPAHERKGWEEQTHGLSELDGVPPWPGRKKRK